MPVIVCTSGIEGSIRRKSVHRNVLRIAHLRIRTSEKHVPL